MRKGRVFNWPQIVSNGKAMVVPKIIFSYQTWRKVATGATGVRGKLLTLGKLAA